MQRVTQPTRARSKRAGASAAHRSVVRSLADGGAERVVVGLPLSFSGADSVQTREVRAFADRPRGAVTVPVELYDEQFTTKLAAPDGDGRFSENSRAAAHLLSGWLDAQRTPADQPGE